MKLNNVVIASESRLNRKDAKEAAASTALQELEKRCYTIMVKNKYTSGDGTTVDANTLEITG